ncbi:nucleotidyltransferase family protein [Streptomyces sp. NPDC050619]|uniref:nucleotidyltransferase family protein n=1 Tax=Streptomyces sp. NPDC050619 TaxID=3157214 RepID=UPI003446D045
MGDTRGSGGDQSGEDQGVEWRILELVCQGTDKPEDADRLRDLMVRTDLNIGELIEQALRHRVLALLVHTVDTMDLWDAFPQRFAPQLRLYLAANARKNRVLTEETLRVVAALEANDVPVACTKGMDFQFSLYGGTGTRALGDVDLMIRPRDVETTKRVMTSLGYVIGEWNQRKRTIEPLSMDTRVIYALSPDHIPNHLLLLDDEAVPVSAIDCAYSLTWARASWQLPMDEVLAERDRVVVPPDKSRSAGEIPTLWAPYSFLFTVLHLFRETWFARSAQEKDVTLAAFTDIHRFWAKDKDRLAEPVRKLVERHALHDPVRWVTGHSDALFHTSITSSIGLEAVEGDPWLNSAWSAEGTDVTWRGSMRKRLSAKTPIEFHRA